MKKASEPLCCRGFFQIPSFIAKMLFFVACGNGVSRVTISAKGGSCHDQRKYQNDTKIEGTLTRGACCKIACGSTDRSKWEQGLSVPDSEMLIALSEALETPVSTLLGEKVVESEADDLNVIAQKLEVINLQLYKRQEVKRKTIRWFFIASAVTIALVAVALLLLGSPYLGWDYSNPETAVLGVAFHSFE